MQLGKHPLRDQNSDHLPIRGDKANRDGVASIDGFDTEEYAHSYNRCNRRLVGHERPLMCRPDSAYSKLYTRDRVSPPRSMSEAWIEKLLEQNADIVAADADVTGLLHRLRVLHQEGQDKAQTAGLLVTKLKRLLRLRNQRNRNLQRAGETD
ncbi:hypothetical protein [Methylobacterium sp. 1030]|uniref:hypothetical protein n=1 Tax=Methylobacterium sp. 1030 TaxID=3156404 RepID=UPI003391522A